MAACIQSYDFLLEFLLLFFFFISDNVDTNETAVKEGMGLAQEG